MILKRGFLDKGSFQSFFLQATKRQVGARAVETLDEGRSLKIHRFMNDTESQ